LPSTADEAQASARRFRITHPFHPQAGCEFPLVEHRRNWSEDRIYFPRPDGKLTSVPAAWTSVCAPDPFVVASAGRAHFRVGDLLELAAVLEGLKS
jgi:hypothetical protein